MSEKKKEERINKLLESSVVSIALMLFLLIICAIFVVIIWRVFGAEAGKNVLLYSGIGVGGGIIITIGLLLIVKYTRIKSNRYLLLGSTIIVLLISLIVSFILRATIADPELSSWAFINSNSVGLGITTGIALTYIILTAFRSGLIYEKKEEKNYSEKLEKEKEEEEK